TGISKERFLAEFNGDKAKTALECDLERTARLGIRGLPAYLVEYGGKSVLIKGLARYEHFAAAIAEVQTL
ncbi:MAG: hypothetical protein IJS09_08415, partial [Treponema sp.]|nr:hypothetical protein [Treponema sp.]